MSDSKHTLIANQPKGFNIHVINIFFDIQNSAMIPCISYPECISLCSAGLPPRKAHIASQPNFAPRNYIFLPLLYSLLLFAAPRSPFCRIFPKHSVLLPLHPNINNEGYVCVCICARVRKPRAAVHSPGVEITRSGIAPVTNQSSAGAAASVGAVGSPELPCSLRGPAEAALPSPSGERGCCGRVGGRSRGGDRQGRAKMAEAE